VWRTTNIRSVLTTGVEAGLKRTMARGASVGVDYTWQSVDADELDLVSKYTLDYARHSLVLTAGLMLPGSVDVGARLEGRDRVGRDPYVLTALRLSRRAAGLRFFAEASNLFDVQYEEVRGVDMPGRWVMVGIEVAK
jgi:outer membrane receptor protein involved in Fe transport